MIIQKSVTIDSIEELLTTESMHDSVRIPLNTSYGGIFGIEAALAQLIITWAKGKGEKLLHLHCDENDWASHVATLGRSSAGLAALVMCSKVDTTSHVEIEKGDALLTLLPMIQAMYDGVLKETSSTRGARPTVINLFSVCSARREYIKPFYAGGVPPKVHPSDSFEGIIDRASTLMQTKADRRALMKHGLASLGNVIYELISNADQHATTDLHGDKYKKGLRGLTIKSIKVQRNQLKDKFSGLAGTFERFIANNMTQGDTLDLLEVSVIDSGPGMARRWLSHKYGRVIEDLSAITIEEELGATMECFEKHVTSKDDEASGMGLHRATKAMNDLKAYVRLRTGRLSLQQTFSGKPQTAKFSPKPWKADGTLSAVEGTVFTICIPVN
ncbi:ATP-binding protein [Pseudomonas sp. NA-150]|uniref:ATP-binding protein n=1 Tax=Pseudomonas sp. NA-150 TaxID=3367525 RepID=UPI0037CCA7EF